MDASDYCNPVSDRLLFQEPWELTDGRVVATDGFGLVAFPAGALRATPARDHEAMLLRILDSPREPKGEANLSAFRKWLGPKLPEPCPVCNGFGRVGICPHCRQPLPKGQSEACDECLGDGHMERRRCGSICGLPVDLWRVVKLVKALPSGPGLTVQFSAAKGPMLVMEAGGVVCCLMGVKGGSVEAEWPAAGEAAKDACDAK